jgi:rhodanese-related sulfurtransferase
MKSGQAGRMLAERGFTEVMNLKGGLGAWKGDVEQ